MQVGVAIVRVLRGFGRAQQEQVVTLMIPFELDLVGVEEALVGEHRYQIGILKESHNGRLTLFASAMHGYTFRNWVHAK
jgi:hypothetical protein